MSDEQITGITTLSPFFDGGSQPSDDSANLLRLNHKGLKLFGLQVSHIESDIKLRAEFRIRTFGYTKKLVKLSRFPAFKALGDIRHRGNARSLDLVPKPVVAGERTDITGLIDIARENAGFLPRDQI